MRILSIVNCFLLACVMVVFWSPFLHGQQLFERIRAQDSTLNNLVDPSGYTTARPGTLGGVSKTGTGTQSMILIPGLGFGGDVFADFMKGFADNYRIYAVTLAGFGGTPAPPCPGESVSFGRQTWTNGALEAIERLMEEEKIEKPIIVGHWLTGTQLALRLAMKHPDNVKAVILLAGAARMEVGGTKFASYYETQEKRVSTIDNFLAPKWFRTVTRATWDDNNFIPGDYSAHPLRGLRLWREAAAPELHVWIRYLCEFNAQDISLDVPKLTVPTLLLKPGLEGNFFEPGQNYMENYCDKSWGKSLEGNTKVTVKTIPNSRACLWLDQPEEVKQAVLNFLQSGAREGEAK